MYPKGTVNDNGEHAMDDKDLLFLAYLVAMLSIFVVCKILVTAVFTILAVINGYPIRQAITDSWNEAL